MRIAEEAQRMQKLARELRDAHNALERLSISVGSLPTPLRNWRKRPMWSRTTTKRYVPLVNTEHS
jgi:hypothetical protein